MAAHEPLNRAALASALEFHRQIGVDLALDDAPHDRYAESARSPATVASQAQAAPLAPAPDFVPAAREARPATVRPATQPLLAAQAGQIAASAAEQAAQAETLEDLRARLEAFEGCALKATATQLVFEDGARDARICFVGEAPGAEEDRAGRPFVGRAGQLLDRMLGAVGLDRSKVYIANMVPWRPPGNRDPSPEELALCTPFLIRQVELVAPKFLVTLGNVPTKSLFQTANGITRMRGQWKELEVGSHRVRSLATLHPAYLLRTPASKALAWKDMLSLRQAIEAENN